MQSDKPYTDNHTTTPAQRRPDRYEPCPVCGELKRTIAKSCRKCLTATFHTIVSNEVFFIDGIPCRWISLTKGMKAAVNEYLYSELSRWTWYAQFNKETGLYYAARGYSGGFYTFLHNQIMGGQKYIDHINRDSLDCRVENLRPYQNHGQNGANAKLSKLNTSGYRGVCRDKARSKWLASFAGKHLGRFDDIIDAARAVNEEAIRIYGPFMNPNVIPDE